MRTTVLLLVAVIALVGTASATAELDPLAMARQAAIKKLAKPAKGVREVMAVIKHAVIGHKNGHAFHVQDDSSLPDIDVTLPACQQFLSTAASAAPACFSTLSSAFAGTGSTAASLYGTLCAGSCGSFVSDLFVKCSSASASQTSNLLAAMCSKDSNGQYCAAVVSSCDSSTSCDTTNCVLTSTQYFGSQCTPKAATSCGTCAQKLAAAVLNVSAAVTTSDLQSEMSDTTCSQVAGVYCADRLSSTSASTLNTSVVCADSVSQRCWSIYMNAATASATAQAQSTYARCIVLAGTTNQNSVQYCVNAWRQAQFKSWKSAQKQSMMCLKNPAGNYCGDTVVALNASLSVCLYSLGYGTCSSSCAATIASAVQQGGCCVAAYAALNDYTTLTTQFASLAPPLPAPMTTYSDSPVSVFDPYSKANACGNSSGNITTMLPAAGTTCPMTLVSAPAKTLQLKLSWNALASNATLQTMLLSGLRQDISSALGISLSNIANDTLAQDTSIVVSQTSSFARRLLQSTSSAGTKYQFTVQSTDSSVATAAASDFDTKISSGSLTLPSTQSAVISVGCSNCGNIASAGGVVVQSSTTTTGDDSGNGAGSLTTMVALILAVVAALF